MPIYRIKCDACEREQDFYAAVRDYDNLPQCCGEKMHRVICAPMVAPDIQPYQSMIDGSMITSRSQHRAHLRDHGCIEVGNEKQKMPGPLTAPPGLKETIIRAANEKLRG